MPRKRSLTSLATEWATRADELARAGMADEARAAFVTAANFAEDALDAMSSVVSIDKPQPRTRTVLMVNAPTLWLKAGEPERAGRMAHRLLKRWNPAPTVARRLMEILRECDRQVEELREGWLEDIAKGMKAVRLMCGASERDIERFACAVSCGNEQLLDLDRARMLMFIADGARSSRDIDWRVANLSVETNA